MELFRNRPLALACGVFALSAVLCAHADASCRRILLLLCAFLLFAFLLAILLFRWRGKRMEIALLCTLAALFATGSAIRLYDQRLPRLEQEFSGETAVTATVLMREGTYSYRTRLLVRIDEIEGRRVRVLAAVDTEEATSLRIGESFHASLRNTGEARDMQLLSDGYLLLLEPNEDGLICVEPVRRAGLRVYFMKWNERLSTVLALRVGGEEGALSSALLLGNRRFLSGDTALSFRRAGVSHLLALSGLHASVLLGALELLLRKGRISKRWRAAILPPVALAYMLLCGASPSIVRAVLLACATYVGFLLAEDYDPFTMLSVVLMGMLLVRPYAVWDLSLWLSFLATAGIVVFLPALTERWQIRGKLKRPGLLLRLWKGFLTALCVGVAANAAILLLSASVFGELSPVSVASTMLLSLPFEGLLWLSGLSMLFPGTLLHSVTHLLGGAVLRTVDWIADMEHAAVRADLGLTWVLLVLSVALLCIFAIIRLKRKIWLLLPALLSAAAMLVPIAAYHLPSEDGVRMDCYVSSSGMTLLFSDRGRAVAVDFSGGASENATLLVNGMREQGCTTLADLVICKETNRSPAFLSSVSQRVRIDRVHLGEGGGPTERAVRARLSEEAVAHSIEVVPALTAFKIESLELVRLHCLRNAREEIEGQLLLLRCEGVRIAYVSGHVPITQLERTLAEQLVQTDLLLVGADAFPASDQLLPRTEATEILLEKKELAMRLPSYGRETTVFGGMGSRSYRLKSSRFSSVDERLLFIFC